MNDSCHICLRISERLWFFGRIMSGIIGIESFVEGVLMLEYIEALVFGSSGAQLETHFWLVNMVTFYSEWLELHLFYL